ncbi:hypothetical protein FRX31_031107 [Thalictrum thalictroides]|uniref:Uncharacterized protein n=1 Tax=Thalictrum thalictroides TaxID=46969 RepID=A0A7J6V2Y6_THATH|nr:hypothetical protein FRX31_031107 [Thalictrum thalictroides]
MPRNGLIEEKCKIRKRGCSSSSASSSSMLQNYRFKRVVLINKRGGSTTPVPRWRMSSRSPASILKMPESPNQKNGGGGIGKGKPVPVSARKLAASLWEMNQMNSPRLKENYEEKRVKKERRNRDRVTRSVQSGYLPQHLSDPSHSPVSERLERSGIGSYLERASNLSQKIRHGHKIGGFDSVSNASYMEVETRSRRPTPTASTIGAKAHLKDLKNILTTSNELLKIVSRMWGIEEHYSSGKSLVSALRTELESASEHVDKIIHEQQSGHKETNYLVKNFAEEKAAWKKKMHEKVESAIKSFSSDLEMEKKLRKRTESLNKTLGRELAETKGALTNVVKELQSEKRARDVMEQVCEELARGVGEDRALVEKLKKESEKVREEVEKEREMLQLADVLREERVQMKLLEAKYQFEEKNAAVEKLRSELEAFLRTKESKQNKGGSHSHDGRVEVGGYLINTVAAYQNQEIGKGKGDIEDKEGCNDIEPEDASTESDLHSIELNMDNSHRNYMWNYATGTTQEDQKRHSVDKESKGRKSTSGKMARGKVSLERCMSDGIEWDFSTENYSNWGYGYDQGAYSKTEKKVHGEDVEIESQRHKSIKDLRDYIMSNSRLASSHGFASPKKQWVES